MEHKKLLENIEKLNQAHLNVLQALVDKHVRETFQEALKKGSFVELTSGMGTWIFKVNGSEIFNLVDSFYPSGYEYLETEEGKAIPLAVKKLLYELHLFLMDMAGTYNVYPCSVEGK